RAPLVHLLLHLLDPVLTNSVERDNTCERHNSSSSSDGWSWRPRLSQTHAPREHPLPTAFVAAYRAKPGIGLEPTTPSLPWKCSTNPAASRGPALAAPTTRYAQSGEASIAYQVVGDAPVNLLMVSGWISHVEQGWEAPASRRFLERLAGFSRLILFDRRGSGLSDDLGDGHTIEQDAEDALAV